MLHTNKTGEEELVLPKANVLCFSPFFVGECDLVACHEGYLSILVDTNRSM